MFIDALVIFGVTNSTEPPFEELVGPFANLIIPATIILVMVAIIAMNVIKAFSYPVFEEDYSNEEDELPELEVVTTTPKRSEPFKGGNVVQYEPFKGWR